MLLLLLSFLCVLVGITVCMSYYRSSQLPPTFPGWLPIVGHTHMLLKYGPNDVWSFYKKISEYCVAKGGVIIYCAGPQNLFFVSDPEDFYTIANSSLAKEFPYGLVKPWLGDGLLSSNGATWKAHRKILNPAFTQQILNRLLPVFNHRAKILASRFEAQERTFNPEPLVSRNNLEVICKTSLGLDSDDHQELFDEYHQQLRRIFEVMFERFQKIWLHSDLTFHFTNLKKKQDEILKGLHKLSKTILQKRKAEIKQLKQEEDSSDEFRPLLDTILELSIDKGIMTEKEMQEELDTILFAGHDTLGITLTYILMLLGSDKTRQEKVYKEISEVMGDKSRDVEIEDLPKLSYIECVIKESLRLYPVGPTFPRVVTKDVKLKNYVIKAGNGCIIDAWKIQRHPLWGPDAEEFNPERWENPDTLPTFNKTFTGFGVGKRTCIGKLYAMMSLKVTLVHLLRRYKITADISKMTVKMDSLLRPQSGQIITIEERK